MSRLFWRRAGGRAVRAAASCLASLLILSSFDPLDVLDWRSALVAAAMSGLVSMLLSIAGSRVGDPNDPSFARTPTTPYQEGHTDGTQGQN